MQKSLYIICIYLYISVCVVQASKKVSGSVGARPRPASQSREGVGCCYCRCVRSVPAAVPPAAGGSIAYESSIRRAWSSRVRRFLNKYLTSVYLQYYNTQGSEARPFFKKKDFSFFKRVNILNFKSPFLKDDLSFFQSLSFFIRLFLFNFLLNLT